MDKMLSLDTIIMAFPLTHCGLVMPYGIPELDYQNRGLGTTQTNVG